MERLDSINSTFIDNSRLGSGEGFKGLVRSKSKGNPTVVALRGSDLIRKSSPAAMAAAVYSKQQEDLKLPEEARQKKFGEGGVGDHLQLIGDKTTSGFCAELGKITSNRRLRTTTTRRRSRPCSRRSPSANWARSRRSTATMLAKIADVARGRGGAAGPAADAAGRRPGPTPRRSPPAPPALPPPNEIPVRPVPARPTAGLWRRPRGRTLGDYAIDDDASARAFARVQPPERRDASTASARGPVAGGSGPANYDVPASARRRVTKKQQPLRHQRVQWGNGVGKSISRAAAGEENRHKYEDEQPDSLKQSWCNNTLAPA